MKNIKVLGFGLFIGFAACQSSQNSGNNIDSIASVAAGTDKIVDSGLLIVPVVQ